MANTASIDLELSSSQYATAADSASTSITGDLTLEAWIKLEQLPSVAGTTFTIVAKWWSGDAKRSYQWVISDTGNVMYFTPSDDGAGAPAANSNTPLTAGVWTHVAVSYNAAAGSATFFVNGVADGTVTGLDTSIQNNISELAIGSSNHQTAAAGFFDGIIDDVRLWSVTKTATDILAFYKQELIGSEANLNAYWKFNNVATDATVNANNLTLINVPVYSTDVPFIGQNMTGLNSKIW